MRSSEISEKERLCLSCRKCCKEIRFYTHPGLYACSYEELIEFYKARGCRITESEGILAIALQHPCPHLTDTGCKIYKKRPKVCKENAAVEELGRGCLWTTLPEGKAKANR